MTNTTTERVPLLDLYRFSAALIVVCFHYFSNITLDSRLNLELGYIYNFPTLDPYVTFGRIGVDLFFLISGFVIALSAEGRSLAAYAASRLTRIVPTYWLAVALTVAVLIFEGAEYRVVSIRQVVANLLFLQKQMNEPFIDGVYWTVIFEFKFYVLVAILIGFNLYRFYPKILLAWVVVCFADALNAPIGPLDKILLTSYGYYFAAGGAFYYLHQRRNVALSLGVIAISLLSAIPRSIDRFGADNFTSAILLVLACYALMAVVSMRWLSGLNWRGIKILGALTYPLYLLHEDIGYVLMRHFNIVNDGLFLMLIIIAIMLFASWLVNRYFEDIISKPLRKWLERRFTSLSKTIKLSKLPIKLN